MPASPSRLLDVATRHQLYLEGLKEYQLDQVARLFVAMEREIRQATLSLSVNSLDQMTRRELRAYLKKLLEIQGRFSAAYTKSLTRFIREYLSVERVVYNRIIADETENSYAAALALGPLYRLVDNAMLPASGMTSTQALAEYSSTIANTLRNHTQIALANGETPAQLLQRLLGTPALAGKDGIINRLYNQGATLTRTWLQGVFATVTDAIYQLYTDRYMWSSIMDAVTTDICRSRNGRVYVYGKGPKPPAHYNCRSTTVPVMQQTTPGPNESWYDWISRQPRQLWADILPTGVYNGLRNGQLAAKDLPKFDRARPMSIDAYRRKTKLITA